MATVTLEGVSKTYPNGTLAVSDLDLKVGDGEFMVLVGPSGCGKTTVMRMVAGLEDVTAGSVLIGDRIVNALTPKDRDIAMVFQNYALYPHMTVGENIGFALKMRGLGKKQREQKALEAAEMLGLTEYLGRKPAQLSGGQRQRVAMGRAIVREPSAFLMDEPLSNLDAKLRVQMRAEITRVHRRLGVATLYVTHDQVEAMTMGDRVAVMRGGVLQQIGPPQEIYNHPENLFVAAFIGSPAMNLYEARVAARADSLLVEIGDQTLKLSGTPPALTDYVDRRVALGVRPEGLAPASADHENGETLRVRVELVELLGPELLVHFGIDARRILPEDAGPEGETPADLAARGGLPAITVAEGIAKANPREVINDGQSLMLAVDRRQLHFFDLQSGRAIR
jgi:multiple sugar transport system ATP-binding protein